MAHRATLQFVAAEVAGCSRSDAASSSNDGSSSSSLSESDSSESDDEASISLTKSNASLISSEVLRRLRLGLDAVTDGIVTEL